MRGTEGTSQEHTMTRPYGGQSMIAPLKRVMLRSPDAAFGNADPKVWHYTSQPNLDRAQAEHAALVGILRRAGAEVILHNQPQPDRADSIFVYDPAIITDHGALILRMGKDLRRGEEQVLAEALQAAGVPILATLTGDACAEGGDTFWLDERTLAIGVGFRTNLEGVRQIREALEPVGITVLTYDLPYYTGPDACLHLLSFISLVDEKLAVVHLPLMPVALYQELRRREYRLIEIPPSEYATQATNVLALGPGQLLMLESNSKTKRLLEEAGCEVQTYRGQEISLKAEGGPTCLTRPVLRG
jgi:dimethylargininase